jgi:hypothetical protein
MFHSKSIKISWKRWNRCAWCYECVGGGAESCCYNSRKKCQKNLLHQGPYLASSFHYSLPKCKKKYQDFWVRCNRNRQFRHTHPPHPTHTPPHPTPQHTHTWNALPILCDVNNWACNANKVVEGVVSVSVCCSHFFCSSKVLHRSGGGWGCWMGLGQGNPWSV